MTGGRIAAIGEELAVQGFGLAGVLVRVAEDPAQARDAWRGLPRDVAVVILTEAAAAALPPRRPGAAPLTVVIPRREADPSR